MPRRSRSSSLDGATTPKRSRRTTRSSDSRATRDAALGDSEGRAIHVSDLEYEERNLALHNITDKEGSELRPLELNWNVTENRKEHKTSDYEFDYLIVRRGQPFEMAIKFDRKYDPENDTIILQLTTGTRPQESKGSSLRLPVLSNDTKSGNVWSIVYKEQEENTVTLTVTPSYRAIVGRYTVFVETTCETDGKEFQNRMKFEEDEGFVLLFNPWCSKDQVYMEDDEQKEEYVLNETGRIYVGTSTYKEGQAWNFGQFEDVSLDAALYLLDKAELAVHSRSNPIHIVRCISAMSNSNDEDGGVLTGRWTDAYPKDSTVPWAWTGSVAILEEFMNTKKAVRFGQCWVFSGVVTTLLRALGIPTRSVTNFESAHDTDSSVTIDYHWDEEDKPISYMNDSVWNFHVWNESWFTRPDLPDGYDGWQAVDSTPQEASEGVMQCGPAPLAALKKGDLYLPYDAPFIFAEVNGDKVHWSVKKDGSMEFIGKEKSSIGKYISTKAVGSNRRNDVTDEYKFKEGSAEERKAVQRAFRFSSRAEHDDVYDVDEPDVKFVLDTPEDLTIGHDFAFTVHMTSESDEVRNVRCRVSAVVSYYTGVPSEEITAEVFEKTLEPRADLSVSLPLVYDDFKNILKLDSMVTVYLKGTVIETKKSYAHVESFMLRKPGLELKVSADRVKVGEEFDLTITFKNPLPTKVTGGSFHIEAAGISKSLTVPYKKAIPAEETIEHTVTLKPRRSGKKEIVVSFSANEISGILGSAEVYVSYDFG